MPAKKRGGVQKGYSIHGERGKKQEKSLHTGKVRGFFFSSEVVFLLGGENLSGKGDFPA